AAARAPPSLTSPIVQDSPAGTKLGFVGDPDLVFDGGLGGFELLQPELDAFARYRRGPVPAANPIARAKLRALLEVVRRRGHAFTRRSRTRARRRCKVDQARRAPQRRA